VILGDPGEADPPLLDRGLEETEDWTRAFERSLPVGEWSDTDPVRARFKKVADEDVIRGWESAKAAFERALAPRKVEWLPPR
jgi:hypothetical protein